jgi:hemerythrin-like domain-containing protein
MMMVLTKVYRDQHKALLEIAAKISSPLGPNQVARNADAIRELLVQLTSELIVHLKMEDDYLYPSLLNNPDNEIKQLARKFGDEMGELRQEYEKYIEKWRASQFIAMKAEQFIAETEEIFRVLQNRIEREDNELFPLVNGSFE